MKSAFLICVAFAAVGCSRPTDYLYQQPGPPIAMKPLPQQTDHHFEQTQKIDEIQTGSGALDFVWLVGGMTEREDSFRQGASDFMSAFVKKTFLTWRMAVLASDPSVPPQLGMSPLFDQRDPNPIATFTNAITQVLYAYDGENVFDPIVQFLTRNPSFVRPEAKLVLMITNDAPDSSSAQVQTSADMLKFLTSVKGDLRNVVIYGVFGSTDLGCEPGVDDDGDWNYQGSAFDEVIQATGGEVFSLCGPSFGDSLAKIGDNLVQRLQLFSRIHLKARPYLPSLVVTYHGQKLKSGPKGSGGQWYYDYDDNAIGLYDLGFAGGTNDDVMVSYDEDVGQGL